VLPYRAIITIFTLSNFKNLDDLNGLLDIFEAFPLIFPHKWAKDDRSRSKHPYDRQAVVEMVMSCWDMETPMLYGGKIFPYEAYFSFSQNYQNPNLKDLNRIYWSIDIPKNFHELQSIFEFSSHLSVFAQAEYGDLNLVWDLPEANQLYSPSISQDHLQQNGMPPLGVRTWIGPHIVSQIGIERLRTCGGLIRETAWGGMELDLVNSPWEADFDTLLQAKQRIMIHLEPSGAFGDYSNYPLPLYSPAQNWKPIPLPPVDV
jgi:hypothetical protein